VELSACGTDSVVRFDGSHVVIDPAGAKSRAVQAIRASAAAYRDPTSLLDALEGPRRESLLSALDQNQAAASTLLDAVRSENRTLYSEASGGSARDPVHTLLEAVRLNKRAVVEALSKHKGVVGEALRRDKQLLAVMLKTVISTQDIDSVDLVEHGPAMQITERDGTNHSIDYTSDQAEAFQALADVVRESLPAIVARQGEGPSSLGLDDLEKLRDLRDAGVITADDFEAKKRQILDLDS
jgi:hypothetical protein